MNIASAFQIIQLVVPAIKIAEDFIRGRGRGVEKREVVLGDFLRKLTDLKKELKDHKDIAQFNWITLGLSSQELLRKVGAVVDAIIDLSNFIETFEEKAPETHTVVN
jgi:hypothetical protein